MVLSRYLYLIPTIFRIPLTPPRTYDDVERGRRLQGTMHGVVKSVTFGVSCGTGVGSGEDGWKKVVVCIVSDISARGPPELEKGVCSDQREKSGSTHC